MSIKPLEINKLNLPANQNVYIDKDGILSFNSKDGEYVGYVIRQEMSCNLQEVRIDLSLYFPLPFNGFSENIKSKPKKQNKKQNKQEEFPFLDLSET